MRWRVEGKVSEKGLLFSSGKLLRVILLTRHEMDIMGVRVELKADRRMLQYSRKEVIMA